MLDDVPVVPLYPAGAVWAMRDWLEVPPHALPWPLFRQARLAAPHWLEPGLDGGQPAR